MFNDWASLIESLFTVLLKKIGIHKFALNLSVLNMSLLYAFGYYDHTVHKPTCTVKPV